MSENLSIQWAGGQGKDLSLTDQDFMASLQKQIKKGEQDLPWRNKKKYKLEVSKKAQQYVLRLIDEKANASIETIRIRQNKALMDLEVRLLAQLAKAIERHTMQAALDIQRDYKDAQALARKLDPRDEEFNEEFLTELRNASLGNLKDIAKLKERGQI